MLLVGYFEDISSQRGIAWRCADSLSLRAFLGVPLDRGGRPTTRRCRSRENVWVPKCSTRCFALLRAVENGGGGRSNLVAVVIEGLQSD